jgi:choice-of-anchor B domain-containing protein
MQFLKHLSVWVFLLSFFTGKSQTYPSQNISLLSHIDPQSTVGIGTDNRKYSGCWGWYQSSTNKEYAIAGSSAGTYFIDISNPTSPTVCAFVPGKPGCTWREMKTYQNYCYIVSDDAAPNRFQIIDMSTLPATVTVVHDGNNTYFERGHTIWIDNDKMYIGSETKQGGSYKNMTVYSLATPSNPVFLASLDNVAPPINVVHDMFVRNDTVYASCGFQGLYVYKFNSASNTFSQLGSFTDYGPVALYNHSSYITDNGKYLVFADEIPAGMPIHVLDVQNLSNIVPTTTANSHPNTTPHNPYVVGNRWAVVSCYQDGLQIYDLAYPNNIYVAGYFDTHPQGGFNVGNYFNNDYRGNWGAYPFFPSGLIVALDMQNGIFILDPSQTYSIPVGLKNNDPSIDFVNVYPNPANESIQMMSNLQEEALIRIEDLTGREILSKQFSYFGNQSISTSDFSNGTYILYIKTKHNHLTRKFIIQH